jgi:hypothetical protein
MATFDSKFSPENVEGWYLNRIMEVRGGKRPPE